MERIWRLVPPEPALRDALSRELKVSPIVAQVLINRGFRDVAGAKAFLESTLEDLHDPFLLPGMQAAVDRLVRAIHDQETILIYGDYDVDGVTSVTLLMRFLWPLARGRLAYYIPNRLEEGYGLNQDALERAAQKGVRVVVTVDCGISAVNEARIARELGMDLIVTDHHEPPRELPEAVALVNPKIPGCPYPFKELSGVGVAFKLVSALTAAMGLPMKTLYDGLDLVAFGTVADIVPLVGENRILVRYGLERLNQTANEGFKALLHVCGLDGRAIGSGQLSYALAPRINAAGRLGNSHAGVQLLLSSDPDKAMELARRLDNENRTRQAIEAELVQQASIQAERLLEKGDRRTLVLAGDGWHHGVIGIVASKIVDRFYRPTVLIGLEGPEGRGSGRSIPGFHLYRALEGCTGHLLRFGGHEFAAGLSISRDALDLFSEAFEALARDWLRDGDMVPSLRLDAEVELAEATLDLARQIALLAPHGPGNPEPVLGCKSSRLAQIRTVGEDGRHLKIQVEKDNRRIDGIGFGMGVRAEALPQGASVDVAFALGENTWNGRTLAQLTLKDIKASV